MSDFKKLADTSAQIYQRIVDIKEHHLKIRTGIVNRISDALQDLHNADLALQSDLDDLMHGPQVNEVKWCLLVL